MAFESQKAKAEEVIEANRQTNGAYLGNAELARHASTAQMLLSVIAQLEALTPDEVPVDAPPATTLVVTRTRRKKTS